MIHGYQCTAAIASFDTKKAGPFLTLLFSSKK